MANIKSYRSPKVEVRGNAVEGRGIFAKEDIKNGEIVFIKAGHIVKKEKQRKLDKNLKQYCLQITDNFFLCPLKEKEILETAIFVNHSCDPNIAPDGQITFRAIKDIKAGQELYYDYAMTTDRDYKLNCECGASNCRDTITGKDWQKKELQEKYDNNFSNFILKKIRRAKNN